MWTTLRIVVVLIVIVVGGEFISPPLSCWIAKGFGTSEAGVAGQLTLMQPGGGVGMMLRRLAEPPSQSSGTVCRATLMRGVGLG